VAIITTDAVAAIMIAVAAITSITITTMEAATADIVTKT
jgi:hypothetical protein